MESVGGIGRVIRNRSIRRMAVDGIVVYYTIPIYEHYENYLEIVVGAR